MLQFLVSEISGLLFFYCNLQPKHEKWLLLTKEGESEVIYGGPGGWGSPMDSVRAWREGGVKN